MLNRIFTALSTAAMCSASLGCDSAAPVSNADTAATNQQEPTDVSDKAGASRNEGNWLATHAILAGAPFADSITNDISLSISSTEYQVVLAGVPDKGTCESDATSEPMRMTIVGTEGPNAGKTFLAICDFPSSEEMRVCYDMNGEAFPSEFSSTTENGYFLVTYKRAE